MDVTQANHVSKYLDCYCVPRTHVVPEAYWYSILILASVCWSLEANVLPSISLDSMFLSLGGRGRGQEGLVLT